MAKIFGSTDIFALCDRFPGIIPQRGRLSTRVRGGHRLGCRGRVWHSQTVHHGLWDYDLPAEPVLHVTAIDMNQGEQQWRTPLGDGLRNHPLLRELSLPPLGNAEIVALGLP